MNRHAPICLAWLAVLAVITFALRSQTEVPVSIQWTWNERRILPLYGHGRTVELGLGSDGHVYWRELIGVTNSPAETFGTRHRSGMAPVVVPGPGTTNRTPEPPPPLPR